MLWSTTGDLKNGDGGYAADCVASRDSYPCTSDTDYAAPGALIKLDTRGYATPGHAARASGHAQVKMRVRAVVGAPRRCISWRGFRG